MYFVNNLEGRVAEDDFGCIANTPHTGQFAFVIGPAVMTSYDARRRDQGLPCLPIGAQTFISVVAVYEKKVDRLSCGSEPVGSINSSFSKPHYFSVSESR